MLKTKSVDRIEDKMRGMDENSLRYQILQHVRNFKMSWVSLGQALYSVWKDKLYREWGFSTFDAYTSKEIGIKKTTAMKLLRSYYFLEKDEPGCLENSRTEPGSVASIPSYDAVNILRLAKKNKMLDNADYGELRRKVFEKGHDAPALRKDIAGMMKEREELEPEEARKRRKISAIKRLLAVLKSVKRDAEFLHILPAGIMKDTANLIHRIEAEIK